MGRKMPNPPPPDRLSRPEPPPPPLRTGSKTGSWDIIKESICIGTKRGTLGRSLAVSRAASLFSRLEKHLVDYSEALIEANADEEVGDLIKNMDKIRDLIDAGVINET